jgi:hypothetical protein
MIVATRNLKISPTPLMNSYLSGQLPPSILTTSYSSNTKNSYEAKGNNQNMFYCSSFPVVFMSRRAYDRFNPSSLNTNCTFIVIYLLQNLRKCSGNVFEDILLVVM